MEQKKIAFKGALFALLGGICWGLSGSMGQYMFQHEGMDSRWLVPIRLGFAGIILFVYCLIRYGKLVFKPWKTHEDRRDLFLYGIAGVSCCQFTYFLTIQLSSAGVATILQDLSPILILGVSCIAAKRLPVKREAASIILALAGVFLISTHGNMEQMSVPPKALLAGCICAFCVMIYNVVPGRLLKHYPVEILQAWAFLGGGLMLALVFRPWEWHYVPTPMGWIGIAFVVLVGNVLAFNLYGSGVKLAGPERAILYGFSEPVTAALISALFLGSSFSLWDAVGFLLIFIMMILIR
ncbi:MAG: DMT family transporter [Lachnospiraceae bacterium]|nr:DMT family transporter [Lachnospiraceae bacterium]